MRLEVERGAWLRVSATEKSRARRIECSRGGAVHDSLRHPAHCARPGSIRWRRGAPRADPRDVHSAVSLFFPRFNGRRGIPRCCSPPATVLARFAHLALFVPRALAANDPRWAVDVSFVTTTFPPLSVHRSRASRRKGFSDILLST